MGYWEDIQRSADKLNSTWYDFVSYSKYVKEVPEAVFKYISLSDDNDGKNSFALKNNMKKLNTLEKNIIFLSEPKSFNDPYDTFAYYYDLDYLKKEAFNFGIELNILPKLSDYVNIASFTGLGNDSMPMWGNYANNHKGFCVEYATKDEKNIDLNASLFPVEYTDKRIDITDFFKNKLIQSGKNKDIRHLTEFLNQISIYLNCLKHTSWGHEKEYRIIRFKNEKNAVRAIPKNIFIGLDCHKNYEEKLLEIARKNNIPIHKMSIDNFSEAFSLQTNKI